tara:strand:- start:965 stop:1474 length:510 start_codon:yes stop_codon:yes gene_type:complete
MAKKKKQQLYKKTKQTHILDKLDKLGWPDTRSRKQIETIIADMNLDYLKDVEMNLVDCRAREVKHLRIMEFGKGLIKKYQLSQETIIDAYEDKLEALYKDYYEIIRAYNCLHQTGEVAKSMGIDIKKHQNRLPENQKLDLPFKQKVMESGKVVNKIKWKRGKDEDDGEK